MGDDKAMKDGAGESAKSSTSVDRVLLKAQKLMNNKVAITETNSRLSGSKRKCDEHRFDFANFKRRRLSDPGNKTTCFTSKDGDGYQWAYI